VPERMNRNQMADDLSALRHPLERMLFRFYVLLNIMILSAALYLAWQGTEWLSGHPLWNQYHLQIRALAMAIVLAPPAVTFRRNTRHARMLGNSIVVSPNQAAALYQMLLHQCERIGMNPPPDLMFSDCAIHEPSHAYQSWNRSYIVLGTTFMQPSLNSLLPVFAFLLGRELGRLRLGHESWLSDLLLSYTKSAPLLINPLMRVFTYSEDRWGAFLAPAGVTGIIAMAAGRRMLPDVNVDDYLRKVRKDRGLWAFINDWTSEKPTLAHRILALADASLISLQAPQRSSRS